MDVLHIMKADHELIRAKLAAFETADGISARRKLFSELEREFMIHAAIEDGYLYPEMSGLFPGADVLVDVCLANHAILAKLLAGIGKLIAKPATEHAGLPNKIGELSLQMRKHVEIQEQSLMPKIRQLISTQEREDLGQVLLDMKADAAAGIDISVPKIDTKKGKTAAKVAGKRKRA
jgi:hypothetical protein